MTTLDIEMYNVKKTADNVVDFFKTKYRQYEMIFQTTDPKYLKSPVISDIPGGGGYGNGNEKKIHNYLIAKGRLNAVAKVMSFMNSQELIVLSTVIGGCSIDRALEKLFIEKSKFYELRTNVLCKFAVAYMQQEYGEDLRVF